MIHTQSLLVYIGLNIAIENGPFIVDLPIKHGDVPIRFCVCLPGRVIHLHLHRPGQWPRTCGSRRLGRAARAGCL